MLREILAGRLDTETQRELLDKLRLQQPKVRPLPGLLVHFDNYVYTIFDQWGFVCSTSSPEAVACLLAIESNGPGSALSAIAHMLKAVEAQEHSITLSLDAQRHRGLSQGGEEATPEAVIAVHSEDPGGPLAPAEPAIHPTLATQDRAKALAQAMRDRRQAMAGDTSEPVSQGGAVFDATVPDSTHIAAELGLDGLG